MSVYRIYIVAFIFLWAAIGFSHNQNILSFSDRYIDSTETRGSYSLFHNPANLIYSGFLQTELQMGAKSVVNLQGESTNRSTQYSLFFGKSMYLNKNISIGANFTPILITDTKSKPQSGYKTSLGFAVHANESLNIGIGVAFLANRNDLEEKYRFVQPSFGIRWASNKSLSLAGTVKYSAPVDQESESFISYGLGAEKKWNRLAITANTSASHRNQQVLQGSEVSGGAFTFYANSSVKVWPANNHLLALSLGLGSPEEWSVNEFMQEYRLETSISYRFQISKSEKKKYFEFSYTQMRNPKYYLRAKNKKMIAHDFLSSINYSF